MKPKKLSVYVGEPIKLKCFTDELLLGNPGLVKWYHNGRRIHEAILLSNNSHHHHHHHHAIYVEKTPFGELAYTNLTIKHALASDAGVYSCKFDRLSEKMHVDVVLSEKSAMAKSLGNTKTLIGSN